MSAARTSDDVSHLICCADRARQCVGRACAAWRYETEPVQRFRAAEDTQAIEPEPRPESVPAAFEWSPVGCDGEAAGWIEPLWMAEQRTRGFCGLAGDPRAAVHQLAAQDSWNRQLIRLWAEPGR